METVANTRWSWCDIHALRYFCLGFWNGMLGSWPWAPPRCWRWCARTFQRSCKHAFGTAFRWSLAGALPTAWSGSLTASASATFLSKSLPTVFLPLPNNNSHVIHSTVMLITLRFPHHTCTIYYTSQLNTGIDLVIRINLVNRYFMMTTEGLGSNWSHIQC